ncbi:uncharacterized protein (TIGR02246 family) [Sphingomonas zeicaulis]|uniref:SgcJ/EcaC family oxidoreductase n=1 Tax=Sphingomonas zeicaulis TaxID=1632740 RepID=UPI003D1BFFF0
MRRWSLALLFLWLLPVPALAQVASPDAVAPAFVAAWNAHDAAAFERLYSEDATWVPVAEERTQGRDAIVREFASIHGSGGWASRSMIALKGTPEIHRLRRDVVTLFFHMDFIRDGKPVPGLQRALILVATSDRDGWRIAAGQLTKESVPAN